MGFRVWGLGFRVQGLGPWTGGGAKDPQLLPHQLTTAVSDSGLRIFRLCQGLGFRVYGFRV